MMSDDELQSKEEIQERLDELQEEMNSFGFWDDKEHAQKVVQRYEELKKKKQGVGKYDKRNAILTIYAGAGGDDAEDFVGMLLEMYMEYSKSHGWGMSMLHQHQTDHGGYRNITVEIQGSSDGDGDNGPYGVLKHESGVHRLVRVSPFDADKNRHTSFAMVEIVPKMKDVGDVELNDSDLEISFSKSGGPGGQNVNKRETAVKITHTPTDISVRIDSQRTQKQNRKRALEILRGKLYHMREQKQKQMQQQFQVSDGTKNEWGNQIRSYVLHPYKKVKDHRTEVEVNDVESVLEDGDLTPFIDAAHEQL